MPLSVLQDFADDLEKLSQQGMSLLRPGFLDDVAAALRHAHTKIGGLESDNAGLKAQLQNIGKWAEQQLPTKNNVEGPAPYDEDSGEAWVEARTGKRP